uniref:Uncharacterized protein n=1 Tax=Tetranychus urticae TaxID=32264 RepID=T1JXU1_TETUR
MSSKKTSLKELLELNEKMNLGKLCECTCESRPAKSPGWKDKNYKQLLGYLDIVQEIYGKPSCLEDESDSTSSSSKKLRE